MKNVPFTTAEYVAGPVEVSSNTNLYTDLTVYRNELGRIKSTLSNELEKKHSESVGQMPEMEQETTESSLNIRMKL